MCAKAVGSARCHRLKDAVVDGSASQGQSTLIRSIEKTQLDQLCTRGMYPHLESTVRESHPEMGENSIAHSVIPSAPDPNGRPPRVGLTMTLEVTRLEARIRGRVADEE
jgi:hypothetical protein